MRTSCANLLTRSLVHVGAAAARGEQGALHKHHCIRGDARCQAARALHGRGDLRGCRVRPHRLPFHTHKPQVVRRPQPRSLRAATSPLRHRSSWRSQYVGQVKWKRFAEPMLYMFVFSTIAMTLPIAFACRSSGCFYSAGALGDSLEPLCMAHASQTARLSAAASATAPF